MLTDLTEITQLVKFGIRDSNMAYSARRFYPGSCTLSCHYVISLVLIYYIQFGLRELKMFM